MIPKIKKPSKKIIYLGIFAGILIIGLFIYKNHVDRSGLRAQSLGFEAATSTNSDLDSDGDGLTDWQEINIWHTDPNNPDTDGDGTLDGAEVAAGRDPTVPNTAPPGSLPNDFLKPSDPRVILSIKTAVSNDNSNNSNLTQNLSKNFVTNFLSSPTSGDNISSNDQQSVIQNSMSAVNPPEQVKKYTLNSLSLYDPSNSNDIKQYANSFASIQNSDLVTYNQIADPSFDQTIAIYQTVSKDLAKLKVPREIAATHLDIINNFNEMYISLQAINNYQDDPVKSTLYLQTFQKDENDQSSLYGQLETYFKNNGIIFDKNSDPGYLFTSY